MPSHRGRSPLGSLITGCYLSLLLPGLAAAQLPSVASINLCTDQLVLSIAEPAQILSLSWLSADTDESMLADEAARYPLNYGSAEELLQIGPDVVIAGTQTSPFARQMLQQLGSKVVAIEPANSLADIARNLEQLGAAIGREQAAARAIAGIETRAADLRASLTGMNGTDATGTGTGTGTSATRSAIVVRPGGFTIGRNTLAFELLLLAGLENSIAELDRWGSLSLESLLTERPDYLVLADYRTSEASLANEIYSHPALRSLVEVQQTLTVEARYFACGAPASLNSVDQLLDQMATH